MDKSKVRLRFRVCAWLFMVVILITAVVLDWFNVQATIFQSLAQVIIPSLAVVMTADYATVPK